jgi:hypothetical protein
MRRSGRKHRAAATGPGILTRLGIGLWLLAAGLLSVPCAVPSAAYVQAEWAVSGGEAGLAVTERTTLQSIPVRDIARHLNSEIHRVKASPDGIANGGNGKVFSTVPNPAFPCATISGTHVASWPSIRPQMSPARAFDARGPPGPRGMILAA